MLSRPLQKLIPPELLPYFLTIPSPETPSGKPSAPSGAEKKASSNENLAKRDEEITELKGSVKDLEEKVINRNQETLVSDWLITNLNNYF